MTSRTVVVLQPSYLPWLGYFAQMHRSDVFVVYDDVQYDKHSWRNRNRIKTAGGAQWLTVPVLTRGKDLPSNREVEIDNRQAWRRKHLLSLEQSYARAPFFGEYLGTFQDLLGREWRRLLDLNLACLNALAGLLRLRSPVRLASELGVPGRSTERLVGICRALGADRLFEGAAGRDYLDEAAFARAGIALEYQDYRHPVYPQLHGDFVPFLSVVDLLFNCGPRSLEVLAQ
jgi:hypothetical protein